MEYSNFNLFRRLPVGHQIWSFARIWQTSGSGVTTPDVPTENKQHVCPSTNMGGHCKEHVGSGQRANVSSTQKDAAAIGTCALWPSEMLTSYDVESQVGQDSCRTCSILKPRRRQALLH